MNVFTKFRSLLWLLFVTFIAARVVCEETSTVPCISPNQGREPAAWNWSVPSASSAVPVPQPVNSREFSLFPHQIWRGEYSIQLPKCWPGFSSDFTFSCPAGEEQPTKVPNKEHAHKCNLWALQQALLDLPCREFAVTKTYVLPKITQESICLIS